MDDLRNWLWAQLLTYVTGRLAGNFCYGSAQRRNSSDSAGQGGSEGNTDQSAGTNNQERTAKNVPIYGDMAAELEMAMSAEHNCPMLIADAEGAPVFDWEKAWASA